MRWLALTASCMKACCELMLSHTQSSLHCCSLGLEGTTKPLARQGDPRTPEGDPVSIWIQWGQGGSKKQSPIEEWLRVQSRDALGTIPWVFTGSVVINGKFLAQREKSIIAVYRDPVALIDTQLPEGAKHGAWFVNEKKVPPVGTHIMVIIRNEIQNAR